MSRACVNCVTNCVMPKMGSQSDLHGKMNLNIMWMGVPLGNFLPLGLVWENLPSCEGYCLLEAYFRRENFFSLKWKCIFLVKFLIATGASAVHCVFCQSLVLAEVWRCLGHSSQTGADILKVIFLASSKLYFCQFCARKWAKITQKVK